MTNQERITSHNALIDEAIEKANALPDAGSGGGASIETCTVVVNTTSKLQNYMALCYTDGEMYNMDLSGTPMPLAVDPGASGESTTNTITDVVCGSIIVFTFGYMVSDRYTHITDGAIISSTAEGARYELSVHVTAAAGGTCTITTVS